ncbi:unnamed protein product [Rotaria sp. Silwood1]|nr:unnamed protein product [Rotaria sp. Silwood1]CAF1663337.1 unnamed protein product [Rotaria sp. Silwood1]CAF3553264.1 unnamed protein product [Rotaria sp. Silwood1]CAF3587693.1 unnamed protein product [Rotaria sp. Silwood1]CAF3855520.1 unnamed protein product [Rotaria sp. Silwood1]
MMVGEKQDIVPYIRNYHLTPYCRRPDYGQKEKDIFGSMCQYKFLYDLLPSCGDIVDATFKNRSEININITDETCHRFIDNCNHDVWPLCLDWREICDGKADCTNAEDEQWCEQLEMTKCADDEYRYHYDGQCIPRTFDRDNPYSIDCLDGIDDEEQYSTYTKMFNRHCSMTSTFISEERIGRYPRSVSMW